MDTHTCLQAVWDRGSRERHIENRQEIRGRLGALRAEVLTERLVLTKCLSSNNHSTEVFGVEQGQMLCRCSHGLNNMGATIKVEGKGNQWLLGLQLGYW